MLLRQKFKKYLCSNNLKISCASKVTSNFLRFQTQDVSQIRDASTKSETCLCKQRHLMPTISEAVKWMAQALCVTFCELGPYAFAPHPMLWALNINLMGSVHHHQVSHSPFTMTMIHAHHNLCTMTPFTTQKGGGLVTVALLKGHGA